MVAQLGEKAANAKPLKGFGDAGVLEVIKDRRGDTYRAVYTVRFASAVYVLHCFQKKSARGGRVPRLNRELIERRLRDAARIEGERMIKKGRGYVEVADIFEALGLEDAAELRARTLLGVEVIAARLSITQPQVSELKRGKFDRFSSDRLIALLGALGCDVEVRVTPAPRRRAGRFTVKAA
jgi:phage-related protein/predicted XRE-type DNA-binding protein